MHELGIVALLGSCLLMLFVGCVVIPLQARKRAKTLPKKKYPCENPENGSVHGDVDYLRISNRKGNLSELLWMEVEEVYAYKEDLFSIDLICMSFKKAGKEDRYEINEDMEGFHDLMEILPSRLPRFNFEWYQAVALPAFERNHRVIWKRPMNELQSEGRPLISKPSRFPRSDRTRNSIRLRYLHP